MYDYQVKNLVNVLIDISNALYTANQIEIVKSKYASGVITANEYANEIANIMIRRQNGEYYG